VCGWYVSENESHASNESHEIPNDLFGHDFVQRNLSTHSSPSPSSSSSRSPSPFPSSSSSYTHAHRKKRALEDAVIAIAESCKKPNNNDTNTLITFITTMQENQNQFNMQMFQQQREFFREMFNKFSPQPQPQQQPQPQPQP
jgi:hypothetical protein